MRIQIKNDWIHPVVSEVTTVNCNITVQLTGVTSHVLVDEIVNQTNTDESEKAIDTVSKVYIMCIYTN